MLIALKQMGFYCICYLRPLSSIIQEKVTATAFNLMEGVNAV